MPTTLSRATELLQKAAGSQATLDSATAAAATARAAVDQATANLSYEREQLAVIDANETAAKAQVASAEANLLSSKFALDDTVPSRWCHRQSQGPRGRIRHRRHADALSRAEQ